MTSTDSREAPGTDTAADGGARQLTTLRGWREFVTERPSVTVSYTHLTLPTILLV